jgi:hypothetical protein
LEGGSTEYGGERPLTDVARESGASLRDTTPWLHRRVERFCHTERLMVRRKVSVDFTIPNDLPPFRESPGEGEPNVYFVPVALLRKWPPMMDFNLADEEGRPIPLLTSQKNRAVDGAALVGLAPPGEDRDALEPMLKEVANLDARGARKVVDSIGTYLSATLDKLPNDDQRKWAQVLRVAGTLVGNSILWVRVEAFPHQRQIVKFAFTDTAPRDLSRRRRLFCTFSWAPLRAQSELPTLGERGSYHLEVEAPPDLAVYRASLELSELPPRGDSPRRRRTFSWAKDIPKKLGLGIRSRYREYGGVAANKDGRGPLKRFQCEVPPGEPYQWNIRERAYFYVMGSRDQYGVASIDLGVGYRGLIASSLRASIVITALLGFLWRAPGSVVHHPDGAIALLVIFPALLALLVIRPGEHPMMRQLIAGVRFLLVTSAILPVVDAVVMLGYADPTAGDVRGPFFVIFILGAVISALLTASWILPAVEGDD